MPKLNDRLVGRTFTDCYGEQATVTEGIAGLAPGYVYVEDSRGRRHVENLRYVLSSLDDPEPDLRLALALLDQADALRERVMEIAGAIATRKPGRETGAAVVDLHSALEAALEAAAPAVKAAETRQRAEARSEPAPAGMRF